MFPASPNGKGPGGLPKGWSRKMKRLSHWIGGHLPLLLAGWYFYGMLINSVRLGIDSTFRAPGSPEIKSIWVLNPIKNLLAVFTPTGFGVTFFCVVMVCLITKKGYHWLSGYKFERDPRGFDIVTEGTHGTGGWWTKRQEIEKLIDIGPPEQLEGILKIVTPSVVFFEEDLSGKNGPMISPATFEEFISPYYLELVPFLRERGVQNVIMDTDGDFTVMIPKILECGLDGVLPVDVNAGVDIVKVREQYPTLKFIGGFNKLSIIDGEEAIEKELDRLRPVIKQGGCIICTDHQAAPHTPLKYYQYYSRRLKEVMAELRNESVKIG